MATRPALALAAALCRVGYGDADAVERWTEAAVRALDRVPAVDRAALATGLAVMRAAVARDGAVQMGADAARAYELSADHEQWRAMACFLEGAGRALTGQPEDSRSRLEEGVRHGVMHAPGVRALCLAELAFLALEEADWAEGADLAAQARAAVDDVDLAGWPACALVFAASAFSLAQRGQVGHAREDAAQARRLLAELPGVTAWYGAQVRVALARAELRLSDAAAARALLEEASRLLRRIPDATALGDWIDDGWERADSFAVGAIAGPATLTNAELRVLRFLPSHLSFREIASAAARFGEHRQDPGHAVYRKLDASSRSAAVRRAREVGLVDG